MHFIIVAVNYHDCQSILAHFDAPALVAIFSSIGVQQIACLVFIQARCLVSVWTPARSITLNQLLMMRCV